MRPSAPQRSAPVLLCVADYHGTLAAVRSLGRAGVPVVVADWRNLVAARWSRYAVRRLTCPPLEGGSQRFLEWLLELGEREPGFVLLPTTDDLAWLFARHRAALSKNFIVDAPDLSALNTLLNKWQLREACVRHGIDAPETTLAGSGRALSPPFIVKPQTQVLLWPHSKGIVVRTAAALEGAVASFTGKTHYGDAMLADDPQAATPMLQQLIEPTTAGIYSLSGYVDAQHFVVNASRKLLQRPLSLGIGLCFETAVVDDVLAERVERLCRASGYHGVFELETLESDGRQLLIDFNPRFFGQMAFDIARGADLPLLAYRHAVGDARGLAQAVEAASRPMNDAPLRWCDRIGLAPFLSLLRVTRRMGSADALGWAKWLTGAPLDAVLDSSDALPGAVAAMQSFAHQAMHPRSTLRAALEG